ncbi:MAG: hypothetical protein ACLQPV_02390 [Vulcanimicrobiaceae bacterium]
MDQNNLAGVPALAGGMVFVIIAVGIAFYALIIWLYWRILERAGFSGALSLLNIVPLGTLVILLILAFGQWPIEQRLAGVQGGGTFVPPPPPPTPPAPPTLNPTPPPPPPPPGELQA